MLHSFHDEKRRCIRCGSDLKLKDSCLSLWLQNCEMVGSDDVMIAACDGVVDEVWSAWKNKFTAGNNKGKRRNDRQKIS
ncbi:hypothetical protein KIN20_027355 [Parelaphostrongylus tenuis]|uniref:Uncharacterized protein n=1 Tax=Parelaphostrongylus tenuis TaxID=148309 RepID=A0AAD5WDQ2_PARTN|nr:hypothetical protein KIN20_027355 [Parelaphostrongylus tenuis]